MKSMDEKAVSEVIGVVLLISVTVLGVALVAVTYFSQPAPSEIPHVSVVAGATADNATFILSHEGGDALAEGSYRIYVETESGLEDQTDKFALEGDDDVWSIGENLTYTGTPGRVVISVVDSGGAETMIAEPVYVAGVVDTGGYVDAGGSGTVTYSGGDNESEEMPVLIVIPEIGTVMDFIKGDSPDHGHGHGEGHYYSPVTANVTDVHVERVDIIIYDYEESSAFFMHHKDVYRDPASGAYETTFESTHGAIKDVTTVVVVAIAFNETDAVVGYDAHKVDISLIS